MQKDSKVNKLFCLFTENPSTKNISTTEIDTRFDFLQYLKQASFFAQQEKNSRKNWAKTQENWAKTQENWRKTQGKLGKPQEKAKCLQYF